MRKLLIATAALAGLLMTTVAANAAGPAGTYTHSSGGNYALCVTNNVVDSGATQMIQVDLGGLPKQPNSTTSPAGWSASTSSAGGTWTIHWTTFGNGMNNGATLCGFGWKSHGKALSATLPLTIAEMVPSNGFIETGLLSTAVRI
jgi:hypothetical protein